MKKTTFLLIFSLAIAAVIFSCKKKESSSDDKVNVTQNTISAKWLVTGAVDTLFTSFEFNKSGSYLIIAPDGNLFGNYTISGSKVTLINYGTIEFTKLTSSACTFKLTPNVKATDASITISATKADEISLTGNTELLCKTWKMVLVNSEPVAGTMYDGQVMFTPAGTYLIHYNLYNTNGISQWKWKDTNQQVLCYNWEGIPTCDSYDEVTINTLTTSNLKMTEVYLGTVYELVPYTAKEEVNFSPLSKPKTKDNFFGR